MGGQPHFGEPCEDCPEESTKSEVIADMASGDLTIELLAEIFMPRKISVNVDFYVQGEFHAIESLVKQYRHIASVPMSESVGEEIVSEIRDAVAAMENAEHAIVESLETTIRDMMAEHPTIEVQQVGN